MKSIQNIAGISTQYHLMGCNIRQLSTPSQEVTLNAGSLYPEVAVSTHYEAEKIGIKKKKKLVASKPVLKSQGTKMTSLLNPSIGNESTPPQITAGSSESLDP